MYSETLTEGISAKEADTERKKNHADSDAGLWYSKPSQLHGQELILARGNEPDRRHYPPIEFRIIAHYLLDGVDLGSTPRH